MRGLPAKASSDSAMRRQARIGASRRTPKSRLIKVSTCITRDQWPVQVPAVKLLLLPFIMSLAPTFELLLE